MVTDRSISIIIPAYNEERYIKKAVTDIHDFLLNCFKAHEIIVIDDGSTDNTHNILLRLSREIQSLKILKNKKNFGKGYSVRRGALSATSEYVAFTDADLSTPIDELSRFVVYLKDGADIVIGSRALKDSNILKRQNFIRESMGKAFNLFVRTFLFGNIRDTQCGFKCFKKDAAKKVFSLQTLKGFCFDAEILYIAKKLKFKVMEVPIRWTNRKDSRVHIIKNSLMMLADLFRIRLNNVLGYYATK